jgi:hypothetical protein
MLLHGLEMLIPGRQGQRLPVGLFQVRRISIRLLFCKVVWRELVLVLGMLQLLRK